MSFPQPDLGFMRPRTETLSVTLTAPRAEEASMYLLTEATGRGKRGGRRGLEEEAMELGARVPRSHLGQAHNQDNYMPSFSDCIKIIQMRHLKSYVKG